MRLKVQAVSYLNSSSQHMWVKLVLGRVQAMDEARDNMNSLGTLERHFKTLAGGPLRAVGDTLPGLLAALRLLWVLSRHYKEDAHMAGLLKRIAVQLADRVEESIRPQVGAAFFSHVL